MKTLLFAAASTCAAWAGMAALCYRSSNQRHRMGLPAQAPELGRWFALAGTALLALSLAGAVAADGLSFGIVLWLCQAGMLGLAMICMLPYARDLVGTMSRVAAVLAPLLCAAAAFAAS
jgi:hypothetical protein